MRPELNHHIPEEILEEFAMQMLGEVDSARWEEHMLICAACQDRVAEADEYIRTVKAAAKAICDSAAGENRPPTTDLTGRRGLTKPMMLAVRHAALFFGVILEF